MRTSFWGWGGVVSSLSSLSWAWHGPSSLGNHYIFIDSISKPSFSIHFEPNILCNYLMWPYSSLVYNLFLRPPKVLSMWVGCFFLPGHISVWHRSLATSHCLFPTLLFFHPSDRFAGLKRLLTSLPPAHSVGEYGNFPGHLSWELG